MAAAEGLVSIHFVNAAGSVLVAPYGGVERRLSTAPFCVGIPREGADPVCSISRPRWSPKARSLVASRGGKTLPPGALIGPDGALSGDPALLYGPLDARRAARPRPWRGRDPRLRRTQGLRPRADLRIARRLAHRQRRDRAGRRFANGMFSLYVDPARIDPAHLFDGDMARYLDWFAQARTMPGQTILTPGEAERASRARRLAEGVPLPRETWESIAAAARAVGVKRDVPSDVMAAWSRSLVRPRLRSAF